MKTILCFGDSNTRGVIPEPSEARTSLTKRYPKNKRWAGTLQNQLGPNYDIVEEGMGGRTTVFDEIIPGRPYRNGLAQIGACLEAHYPLDLVIFMLGTNDTKIQFQASAKEISEGMSELIHTVQHSGKGPSQSAPHVLLIAPSPILPIKNLDPKFDSTSIEKSHAIIPLYQDLADKTSCEFLDASLIVTPSQLDGLHLDEDSCQLFAHAIAEKILNIRNWK